MADGLETAHEKGIVHRDIKPDNVMLMNGSRGLVKLMDFGLAQLAESSKLTREGTTLGTPIYMSPEQALGEPTDSRSDVWGNPGCRRRAPCVGWRRLADVDWKGLLSLKGRLRPSRSSTQAKIDWRTSLCL